MFLCFSPPAVQSLNSLNDQIASFMVTGPKTLEQEEHAFIPPEKETLQKSMTLMRHLLVDAQVHGSQHSPAHTTENYKTVDHHLFFNKLSLMCLYMNVIKCHRTSEPALEEISHSPLE